MQGGKKKRKILIYFDEKAKEKEMLEFVFIFLIQYYIFQLRTHVT